MTVERVDREGIEAFKRGADHFRTSYFCGALWGWDQAVMAEKEKADALAGALRAVGLRHASGRCDWIAGVHPCPDCRDALALLDRLGYGAGEGEG